MVTEFVSFASDVALLSEQVQNTVGATDTVAHYLSGGNLFIDIVFALAQAKGSRDGFQQRLCLSTPPASQSTLNI